MQTLSELRTAVHEAVDRVFDQYEAAGTPGIAPSPDVQGEAIGVTAGEVTGAWKYRWPGGEEETFSQSRWYETNGPSGRQRVRVAWARRAAWGRSDRRRAIVFNQVGSPDSTTYYPWTEFVETDHGRFAAAIPDPGRPRAMLTDAALLPARFKGAAVERSDALFDSVAEGPSLRLVVDEDDEATMVRHGYWVATLRRRI